MRAVKSVSIDSERRVIITFLDGSTETLYPNCIWCDAEVLKEIIKELLEEKADAIVQTINNVTVATFEDGADEALIRKLLVSIGPIQDLHGYDSPWPSGGGDCVLRQFEEVPSVPGLTISIDNGKITINGTVESTTTIDAPVTGWQWDGVSDYWLSGCPSGGSINAGYSLRIDSVNNGYSNYDIGNGVKLTSYSSTNIGNTDLFFRVVLRAGTYTNLTFAPMLNAGLSAKPYSPYANICPISGRTDLTVHRSGSDTSNPTEFPITWEDEAGTVYGGTLDVISGKLTVDRECIASYNGEALPSTWISDRDVYAEGTTPTTGAQVVYNLAEPVEYQLTPQEITTLLGINNIWTDSGNILELEYVADTKLYIGEQE